jgi:hypothetical protein
MKRTFWLVGLVMFFFCGPFCWSVWAQGVVINEFSALSSPDWIELYNLGEEIISLDGWELRDETQNNKIDLDGLICPDSFRRFYFSNRLNNGGDEIRLIDDSGSGIDRVVYFSQTIPAHLDGQSTGRNPNGADFWQVFSLPSPQDEACFLPTPTPTVLPTVLPTITLSPIPTPTPTVSLTPAPTPSLVSTPTLIPQVDYDNVFLNEVMANPAEGAEWVELYNGNDFTVDLQDWFLDDLADGGSAPQKFSLTIEPGDFGIINLSRAILNNNGDEVRLLNFSEEEKDLFSYSKTVSGQSWGKTDDDNWCLQEPTPQEINLACFSPTPTITPTPIVENRTIDQKDQEKSKILGNYQHYQINQVPPSPPETYLMSENQSKEKLRKERSSLSQKNWLPDWLLLTGGFLNFGIGLVRILKKITP